MDKSARIAALAETEEDRILLAKVYDKITAGITRNIPAVTAFLTPREQVLAASLLREETLTFFGGIEAAERKILCYLPDYLLPEDFFYDGASPVRAIRAEYYAGDALTHRDFLGSLMGCGVKRETVGDIFVSEGNCDFFVTAEILPYLLQNLESAGRTKLHLREIPLGEVSAPQAMIRQIRSTVSSLRLDSVIGVGFGLARAKAAAAIEAGKVTLNHLSVEKPDKTVSAGDIIALRGMGKMCLREVGGRTRKDRVTVVVERYE